MVYFKRSHSGEGTSFPSSTQDTKTPIPVCESDKVGINEPVRRPSIADLKKSIWFQKKGLTSKDVEEMTTRAPNNCTSEASRGTFSSSMTSSTSSLLSSRSSKTITNSLSVSKLSGLFRSDTLSNCGGSVDSVIVKMKETAVPLPPAVLVDIPPIPPPKSKTPPVSHRSSSCPNRASPTTRSKEDKDPTHSSSR